MTQIEQILLLLSDAKYGLTARRIASMIYRDDNIRAIRTQMVQLVKDRRCRTRGKIICHHCGSGDIRYMITPLGKERLQDKGLI